MTCKLCCKKKNISGNDNYIMNRNDMLKPIINYFCINNKMYICMHIIYKLFLTEFFKVDFSDYKIIKYKNEIYYVFPFRLVYNPYKYIVNIYNEFTFQIINNNDNNNIILI